jgi:selenoprotein W-related protein
MTTIEIEYCVPCGLLDNATETQYSLLEEYGQDLDAVRLKPGHGGVFEVRVDGETVYDKDEHEDGYDLDAVRAAVRETVPRPA